MNWMRPTITRKFLLLLIGFLVLQLVQLGASVYGVLHLGAESATINDAGKQRMRTLLIGNLARAALAPGAVGAESRRMLTRTLAEYEQGFDALEAYLSRPHYVGSLADEARAARAAWRDELYPLISHAQTARPAPSVLARYDALSIAQVARLDRVVATLEDNVREDSRRLAVLQMVIVGLSLLLGAVGLAIAQFVISRPLQRFIEATRAIADGAYDRRVELRSRDELGELAHTFNRMAAAFGEKTARLRALNEVALAVTASLSLRKLLDEIALYALPLSGAQGVCIAFYDSAGRRFTKWVTRGMSDTFVKKFSVSMGGVVEDVLRGGDYLVSNDLPGTPYPLSALEREEGVRSLICLPLTSGDQRLGVIYFYHRDAHRFEFEETELLRTFSHLAAHAIENARLHATTVDLAEHDTLTGLYNRRKFEQRLHEEILRAQRSHQPLAVLLLDVDYFKRINDTHGHGVGDVVLKTLAGVFRRELRGIDLVARVGGEEFMFVLPETDPAGARLAAERLRRAIAAEVMPLENAALHVTASVGIACYSQSANTVEALVAGADRAMYAAKERGRNRAMLYSDAGIN